MNILVTGSDGFVGKNLCVELKNIRDGKDKSFGDLKVDEIFEFDIDTDPALLEEYCRKAHLSLIWQVSIVRRIKANS